MGRAVLFVFAHQDDEVAAVSRIVYELERGADVYCAYLTDGAWNVVADVRDAETKSVLTQLGVAADNIFFIGSSIPIRDATLVEHLDIALERLEQRLTNIKIETLYCLAFEGGHQDHDASHLVAVAFARRRGILDQTYEVSLYNGWKRTGQFFRAFSPAGSRDGWIARRIPLRHGLRFARLPFKYPSQWSSWVGLSPAALLQFLVTRRELMRKADIDRLRQRPHEGALLYERRFRYPHERFAHFASFFVRKHLS